MWKIEVLRREIDDIVSDADLLLALSQPHPFETIFKNILIKTRTIM